MLKNPVYKRRDAGRAPLRQAMLSLRVDTRFKGLGGHAKVMSVSLLIALCSLAEPHGPQALETALTNLSFL